MPTDLHFFAPDTAPIDTARIADRDPGDPSTANSVFLAGPPTEPAEERDLAGGVKVVRWTLRVPRGQGGTATDLIDCVAYDPALQRRALGWAQGQELVVEGAIRRRFFRTGGRTTTRVEVEAQVVSESGSPSLPEPDSLPAESPRA